MWGTKLSPLSLAVGFGEQWGSFTADIPNIFPSKQGAYVAPAHKPSCALLAHASNGTAQTLGTKLLLQGSELLLMVPRAWVHPWARRTRAPRVVGRHHPSGPGTGITLTMGPVVGLKLKISHARQCDQNWSFEEICVVQDFFFTPRGFIFFTISLKVEIKSYLNWKERNSNNSEFVLNTAEVPLEVVHGFDQKKNNMVIIF